MPMNKRFFQLTENQLDKLKSRELKLWLLVHLSIPLLLLLSIFFKGPVRVNTSLFDMLPQSRQAKEVMEADKILGEKSGREIVILACAPDFQEAKKGAVFLYDEFKKTDRFENISLYFDSQTIESFYRFFFDYRFVIASDDTLELLENGGTEEIAYYALANAFGAFNLLPLDNIENDPFFLVQRRMENFISSSLFSGNMTVREDVLAAQKDDMWYVLLRMTLAPLSVSIQADRNITGKIYSTVQSYKEAEPETNFYFSGVPFHSYESSSGAQKEISLICTVTLILILIIFIYIFRSVLPVLFSVMAVTVSLALAASAALLFFREIHIITFVFGTTLIGTCIDYSVHFFTHWKGNPSLKNGAEIRRYISKSLLMSFLSTEICFFVFIFAPFPILKQFAVFSMAGLLSSFLTCFCIYPRLKLPPDEKRQFQVFTNKLFVKIKKIPVPRKARLAVFAVLLIAAVSFIAFNFSSVKIKNDLSSLYTMSNFLMESEKKAAQVLDYSSSGWYFIVSGKSAEETLQHEENLAARLKEEIVKGNMGSFLGTSVFVPSVKTQSRTYEAMKNLLPLVPEQFENLGFPPQYAEFYEKEFVSAERYCLPEDTPRNIGVSNLWIGEKNGDFYSCVMPLKPTDEAVFRAIAEEFDYVHFINKQKDIGRDLDTLTKTILIFFLAAALVISIIVRFVYPLKDSLKIYTIPVSIALSAAAVLAANKIPLGFFSAAALVLVFGLGLDYVFYMTLGKKEKDNLSLLAVTLSFLTTLFSFGALALSGFVPVHIFGLTVSAGLGAAFISAVILQSKES